MSLVPSKIKTFMKSKKLNVFLIFFLLAFFILVLSRLSANYTSTVKFKVNLENVPEEMIVLNDSLNTLNLTMSTNGFAWLKYYTKEKYARIYLEEFDQIQRFCDYLRTTEPATEHRADFVRYIQEYDKRRGKNFSKVFPYYAHLLEEWNGEKT